MTPSDDRTPPRRRHDAVAMFLGGLCIAALGGPLLWAAFR